MEPVELSSCLLLLAALGQASVVPTTYRPNTATHFFRRDSTFPSNATYRLWGKTYTGHGISLPVPTTESLKRSDNIVESDHDEDIKTNQLESEDVSMEETYTNYQHQPIYESQMVTFEDISNTSYLVIKARGVATALWDTVNIIYQCVRDFWGRGIVHCLTARTESMLDNVLGTRYRTRTANLGAGVEGPRDITNEQEGRKKTLKKLVLPLTIALKVKFFLVLVAVSVLAGKALLLSTASFLISLVLYLKKATTNGGHSSDQITVYPSYHNKRVDDVNMNLNGGRGLYM